MAERAWAFVPDPNGRHRSGIRIECASCSKDAFFAPNSGGRFPSGAATNHFARAGWTVGKGPRRDFCPACTEKQSIKPEAKPTMKSPSMTPPRTMTRDDRRVIIAEVKGCYDEENKRYIDGWHDERVAQALGSHVPVGWVREVREDYFGEGASNEQFDELIKRCERNDAEVKRIETVLDAADTGIRNLKKVIEEMKPLLRDVQRAVGK